MSCSLGLDAPHQELAHYGLLKHQNDDFRLVVLVVLGVCPDMVQMVQDTLGAPELQELPAVQMQPLLCLHRDKYPEKHRNKKTSDKHPAPA